MNRMRLVALGLICASVLGAQGTDTVKQSTAKKVVNNTGKAIDKGAKDTKVAVVKGAKDTKNATVTAAKDTKNATVTAAKDTKNAVVKGAKDTKKFAKKVVAKDTTKKP